MMLLLSVITQIGRMQQTQKTFNQHEKSAVYRSGVNRFVEVSSSTDILLGE